MGLNSSKQIKIGAIISYGTIAFHIIAGLIYTPWLLSQIGQSDYGLYTLATSLITMFVMDFGLGAAISRYVSRYRAQNDQKAVNDFLGMIYKLYMLIDALIFIVLLVVFFLLDTVYVNLSPEELEKFKILFIIVALFSVISFPFSNLNGVLTSYEKFIVLKLCDFFNKALNIVLVVIALMFGWGVYALVLVHAVVGLMTIVFKLLIIKQKTPVKVNFKFFDKSMLKEIFGFSMWTTVGNLLQRLILGISPSIIAAVCATGSVEVAIFGLASTVEGYIYTFATAINGMFMPRISKIIVDGKKDTELMPLMIKVGRIQLILIGMVSVGFLALGKSFIVDIWNKPDFAQSYYCAILLLIPNMLYLPMQIANTTLVVENKVKIQAQVFMAMSAVNVVLSLIFSHLWGAVGAALAVFIAYLVRIILMIIVYQKSMNLDMVKFVKDVFLSMSPYLIITFIVGYAMECFNPLQHGLLRFAINGAVLVGCFGVLMLVKGFNKYERNLIFGVFNKILRKLKISK